MIFGCTSLVGEMMLLSVWLPCFCFLAFNFYCMLLCFASSSLWLAAEYFSLNKSSLNKSLLNRRVVGGESFCFTSSVRALCFELVACH